MCVCVCVGVCESRSVVSDSCVPWSVARQAPLSMWFFQQEYWSGLPFPPPGDLPDLAINSMSPALAGKFFTWEAPLTAMPSTDGRDEDDKDDDALKQGLAK